MILDAPRSKADVEIKLKPLVRVFGSIKHASSGDPASWTCAYLNLPHDEKIPTSFDRIGICGSYGSKFAFALPAGEYNIEATSDSPNSSTLESIPFAIQDDSIDVDLGALLLRPRLTLSDRIERAKAEGTWGNYKEHFGHQPPPWSLTDARGIRPDSQLSDFKGKWVCLYLWTPNCAPCLSKELPRLAEFYRTNDSQRERFEILSLCCDFSGTITSINQLDIRLESVKKNVWRGQSLPFPVLLDSSFLTYERFGLEGSGVSNLLLIDPDGRLVPGDLNTLSERLGIPVEKPR